FARRARRTTARRLEHRLVAGEAGVAHASVPEARRRIGLSGPHALSAPQFLLRALRVDLVLFQESDMKWFGRKAGPRARPFLVAGVGWPFAGEPLPRCFEGQVWGGYLGHPGAQRGGRVGWGGGGCVPVCFF